VKFRVVSARAKEVIISKYYNSSIDEKPSLTFLIQSIPYLVDREEINYNGRRFEELGNDFS